MRLTPPLAVCCTLLVLATAACGGSKKAAPPVASRAASRALAATIVARLKAAGYAAVKVVPVGESGTAPPHPVAAFKVRVDFTSPHSFTFFAVVFASPADASLTIRRAAAQCNSSPQCRRYRQQAQRTYRQKLVAPVVYSATSDDGHSIVSQAKFDRLVAIASGKP